jgi:hypothetical protein
MSVHRRSWELVDGVHQENPITPELRYLTAKMAALMPFGKVADFLSELLPWQPLWKVYRAGL